MVDENKDVYIYFWLLLITLLVALIIVIGGLTRLTESGLSITNWDLFSGILPPLNIKEWEHFFKTTNFEANFSATIGHLS